MRDDLHRAAEIVAFAFFAQQGRVDAPGGDVVGALGLFESIDVAAVLILFVSGDKAGVFVLF